MKPWILLAALLFPQPSHATSPAEMLTACLSGEWQGRGLFVSSSSGEASDCELQMKAGKTGEKKMSVEWAQICPGNFNRVSYSLSLEENFRFDPSDKNYDQGMWSFDGLYLLEKFNNRQVRISGSQASSSLGRDCVRLSLDVTKIDRDNPAAFRTLVGTLQKKR